MRYQGPRPGSVQLTRRSAVARVVGPVVERVAIAGEVVGEVGGSEYTVASDIGRRTTVREPALPKSWQTKKTSWAHASSACQADRPTAPCPPRHVAPRYSRRRSWPSRKFSALPCAELSAPGVGSRAP